MITNSFHSHSDDPTANKGEQADAGNRSRVSVFEFIILGSRSPDPECSVFWLLVILPFAGIGVSSVVFAIIATDGQGEINRVSNWKIS